MAKSAVKEMKKEFTFIWRVENYSYCWHKLGEFLISPVFVADLIHTTSWALCLYPRGDEDDLFIGCYLQREVNDEGPQSIMMSYEITCLAADGSALSSFESSKSERPFEGGTGYGNPHFLSRSEVLGEKRKSYLPKDTLTLSCKMWVFDENRCDSTQCFARTRIQVETISFVHTIEYFSEMKADIKQTVNVNSSSEARSLISVDILATNGSCCEEKIVLELVPGDREQVEVFTCRLQLLNAARQKLKCGQSDTRFDLERKENLYVPLIFTKKQLLEKKNEFLPNDSLTLICECSFSIGVEFEKIEKTVYGPLWISTPVAQTFGSEIIDYPTICDDYRCLLNDPVLSDITLKTKTKTFPAHKAVLIARSSVFRDLLTKDTNDKDNKDCIEVEDLEDEALHRLLIFIYSDVLEDLHWGIACKLYYAAHKYQIHHLKAKCLSFLLSCLDTSNASDLLLLAHIQQDSDLKISVLDFILEHEEEVFGSSAWEKLMETNPNLAMKTMHLRYKKKK
ncbi:TD and POZ domain-containing protein 2 [Argiope bruennichi]|uniref:TD and POZ domain-containing protein 2 n=1 Tax=Argiope bruennichi TaxID=94029 RepID=A0A8T0EUM5_ARGBR|nr:TD and POZ domain-containing protein 2 [Argiope bruennichi]